MTKDDVSTLLNANWNALLDEVKSRFALDSEVQLAALIRVSPAVLGHVRTNRTQLSLHAKIQVADKLGYVLTRDLIVQLLPTDARQAVLDIDNERARSPKARTANSSKRAKSEQETFSEPSPLPKGS